MYVTYDGPLETTVSPGLLLLTVHGTSRNLLESVTY